MFVGGEFYSDNRWLMDKPTLSTESMTFLNGGKACLVVISDNLLDHGIKTILLPSYLCPTIVNTLEHCGLTCEYYQINPDFSIDMDDLDKKVAHHQAVYFINYFGFLHPATVRNYLAGLRQKGVIVIEDNAQAGAVGADDHPTGDFIFNSMRKLAAFDGGYLTTPFDVTPYLSKYKGRLNRRLPVIRAYRSRLADYLYQGADIYDELKKLYNLAEELYETDLVVEGDAQERRQIECLDWKGIQQVRRENYAYLLGLISGIPELTPIFPALQPDNMPLGLPVYVSGVARDELFDELGNAGIGLTIHWDELLRDPRLNGNPVAVGMASKILTLVIDQRTSHNQMDYLTENIRDCIKNAKTKNL
jgi:dTDP-4-amino-4,6-dideoxygalactose transaminase